MNSPYDFASPGTIPSPAPESVRPGAALVEWRKLKDGAWIGYSGSQLLCIVEKIEGLPVEGWSPHCLRDAFSSPEAAMQAGELLLRSIARDEEREPAPKATDIYLPIFKGIVAALESPSWSGATKPPEATAPTEAKA